VRLLALSKKLKFVLTSAKQSAGVQVSQPRETTLLGSL
jgi:hypothetical protein